MDVTGSYQLVITWKPRPSERKTAVGVETGRAVLGISPAPTLAQVCVLVLLSEKASEVPVLVVCACRQMRFVAGALGSKVKTIWPKLSAGLYPVTITGGVTLPSSLVTTSSDGGYSVDTAWVKGSKFELVTCAR